jgi:hypothetical protein
MAFWTAQLAECVEENVDKRNRVGAVAVPPSIHLHLVIGGDGWTELGGVVRRKGAQQVPVRLRSGQALGYARDDKFEGGGAPWHGWRWMDRVE